MPVAVRIPGLTPAHELDFLVTYDSGNTIPSLNILDAVGTYGLSGLSVFDFGIGRFGNQGSGYNFTSLSIAVPAVAATPAPATWLVVTTGGLLLSRLRRRAGVPAL